MNVTFLGTSSMTPTKTRGQSGIYVDCGKEKILLDCGENIQRQMRIIGISPPKTTRIFKNIKKMSMIRKIYVFTKKTN